MREWGSREDAEPECLWGRVAIQEPGGRMVEVDIPSGWPLAGWQAYAETLPRPWVRRDTDGGLPKPRQASGPVNLDEALGAACEGVAGVTPAQFRALLSPEDVEAGALRAYAQAFAEGIRSERDHGTSGEDP